MMDAVRWERIQELFHATVDLPATERRRFLEDQCVNDPALLAEVMALLDEDRQDGIEGGGGSLLDRGLAQVAEQVIGTDPAPSLRGKQLGPYRIGKVIGEGGMGVVYLAERTDLGTVVAIKLLRDAWLSPARRERFASEQRTLAQLNHPSIARLYDADSLPDGTPWFVMEYVEGLPLTEYCRVRQSSLPGRLLLFRAVCEAVQHAHRHLVIHRDLKPSNVLVKDDGTVKLLDFGIAKQLESLEVPVDQTKTGLRLMTPAYAAPEQLRGGRVGIHTDIYSLGVILYELLAGRLPFDLTTRSPAEAERIITEEEPAKPSVIVRRAGGQADGRSVTLVSPGLKKAEWADLDVLCLTAMHKDPQRRYATVDALIRDIDHYLAGEPLEARPDTLGYRVGKFVRRNRPSVTAAATVLAVVIGLVVFYTVRLTTARNAALAESARTQRIQSFMLNLFEGGDPEAGPADSLRVVTLVDRGVQEARSLSGEPEVQAELYLTLGGLYQKLGNLDRADSLLRTAVTQRTSLFGADHPDVAESEVSLGLLRVDQAKYEEAEQLIRAGLGKLQRHLAPSHALVAKATTALGLVLEERGEYAEAIEVLEEAVRLHSSSGGAATPELAASLYELANSHFYAGHLAESDSLNRMLLTIHGQLYGERHPLVADNLVNLGAAQQERGEYAAAEQFHRQALEITQAWYGRNHYKTAGNLTQIGRALVFQNRFAEAAEVLREALAVRERVYGPAHPAVASTLNELGSVALQQDRYDEAEGLYRRMEDIYRAIYNDDHYLIALAMANRASVYMNSRQYAKAEPLFREVITRYTRAQGAEHLNTGIARIKLGRVLLRQGKFAEAQVQSLAGYEILSKQTNPGISFLRAARTDLAIAYDSLHQPDKAARFRAELADTSKAKD